MKKWLLRSVWCGIMVLSVVVATAQTTLIATDYPPRPTFVSPLATLIGVPMIPVTVVPWLPAGEGTP